MKTPEQWLEGFVEDPLFPIVDGPAERVTLLDAIRRIQNDAIGESGGREMKTNEELVRLMQQCPAPGACRWRHKKSGNLYKVVRRCLIEATLEPAVVYSPIDNPALVWCRPLSEWDERFEVFSDKG